MLDIDKLCLGIDKKVILDDASFSVGEGEFAVVTGPNGSGKSTLAKIIMGIIKPDSGEVRLNGENLTDYNITERAKRGIAFAFQLPIKIKGITVRKLLQIASGKKDVDSYLRMVGLEPDVYLERELGSELSGGELKRIEIASVLARDADLMIFDEPEAGIDLWSFDNLVKMFQKLKKQGKTLLIISHQERILKNADNIVLIKDGKVAMQGNTRKMLDGLKDIKR